MHGKFSRLQRKLSLRKMILRDLLLDERLRKIQKHQETFLLPCQVTLQPDESTT